jgi:TolB protein
VRSRLHLALPAVVVLLAARPSDAQDTTWKEGVRITGIFVPGMSKPGMLVLPIAGPDGDSVRAIFQRDFENGDRMNVIALAAPDVPPAGSNGQPINYPLYVRLGAAVLLQVTPTSFGIHVTIHNAVQGKIERVKNFPLPSQVGSPNWRLAVHTVADDVEQMVTGVRGISATRILYESQGRVWQIDSDGANPTPLTPNGMVMSPAWHPYGSHIVYHSITSTGHQLVLREAGGATRTLNLGGGALVMSPAFSQPDGSTLIYALARENGTDLYAVNPFTSEPPRRVSVGRGRESVSPTFSHDGRQIAFTSDRAGPKNVYISDADGTNAEPLVPAVIGDQSYRSNPDWSPDGRLIAFQSQIDGNFQLMTIGVRDRAIKRLTSTGINEDPSWAPDSRHLVFTSTRGGSRQLWVMDAESGRFRQLTHASGRARMGAWSRTLTTR